MPSTNPYEFSVFETLPSGEIRFAVFYPLTGSVVCSGTAVPVTPDFPEFETSVQNRHTVRFLNRKHLGEILQSSGIFMPEMEKYVYFKK